ncbi:hypothetical protein KJ708_01500 [bacterium]|nr:hypothetical protein [bacterium]
MINKQSSDFEKQSQNLIKEIEEAFCDVLLEDGVTISQAMVIDDYGTVEQEAEARKQDTESCWQDITDQKIIDCCSVFSYLDAKGFHFYIPAYLRTALRNFHDDPNGICSSCEFYLSSESSTTFTKTVLKIKFTVSQVKAIIRFLSFIIAVDEYAEKTTIKSSIKKWEKKLEGC